MLPGLTNIELEDLKAVGINVTQGYSFKGESKKAAEQVENSGFKCEHCGAEISSTVASFSKANYQKELCMKCQKLAKEGKLDDSGSNESADSGKQTTEN